MTGPETDAPIDASPAGGRGGARALGWVAGFAAAAVTLIPPAGPIALAALAAALLVLLVTLGSRSASSQGEGRAHVAAAGGGLLVVGLLAAANPWVGAIDTVWPWDMLRQDRAWAARADLLLMLLTGLFALGVAVARPRGPAAFAALLAIALLLAARGGADDAALPRIRGEDLTFLWTSGACALGAGLLHLSSARPGRRGIARCLVLVGAAGMVCAWAGHFPAREGEALSSLATSVGEVRRVVEGFLLGGEHDAEARRKVAERGLALAVPFALRVLALVLGLVVAATPSRHAGRLVRSLALLGLLAVFLAWLVPPKAALRMVVADQPSDLLVVAARHATDVALRSGLASWLLAIGAVSALLASSSRDRAPAWPRGGARSYAPRWTYVVGAVLLLAAIVRGFHAGTGAIAAQGLLSVLRPARWDPAVAALVFLAVALLASLVATTLPAGAGRGGFVATASVVAWAALTPAAALDYGIEAWVPLATLAVAAGALHAGATASGTGRDAARWTAGAAGGVLLLLLLYPLPVPEPDAGGAHTWNNALLEWTRGWEGVGGTPALVASTAPWRVGVVVGGAVALLGLLFALRGRAAGGRVAAAAFLFHIAYTCFWEGLVDFHDVRTTLFQWGDTLLFRGLPMALLLWSGVRDLHATPGAGVPAVGTPLRRRRHPG